MKTTQLSRSAAQASGESGQTTTMQAIVQHRYGTGPKDVLRLERTATPAIAANEVLVQVRAAGVDRGTWHLMAGQPYLMRLLGFGLRGRRIPCQGWTWPARSSRAAPALPGSVLVTRCSASPAAPSPNTPPRGRTSWRASRPGSASSRPQPSRSPGSPPCRACTPGASMRGRRSWSLALQEASAATPCNWLRPWGAEVTGVCSTGKTGLVRSIGADQVIDYTQDDFAEGRHHYDLILDIGGNSRLARLRRALTPTGTLVIAGGEGAKWTGVGRQLRALMLSPFTRQRLTMYISRHRQADLEILRQLTETGQVTPIIGQAYR
jgi:hypothetical protein